MKKSLLTIPMVVSCLLPAMTQAYTLTIQSDLNLNQVDPKYTAALISCSASQLNGHSDRGQTYAPLIENSTNGGIEITIDATKPLLEYDSIGCAVQLCRIEGDRGSCRSPNASSDYDEGQPHRISHYQSLADSLLMVVPPPSYQMAGQNKRSNSANQSAKNSGGGKSRGKKPHNATIGSVAGDANTIQGYGELGAAMVKVGVAVWKKDVGLLGSALTDLTMNGTGVATNAAFGAADSDAIGIVGDIAGLGLGFASAAASAAAGGAAVTVATAALPLTATLTGSLALGSKINKAADEPFLWWLEQLVGYDEEPPKGYNEAVTAFNARRAAEAAAGTANAPSNQQDAPPTQPPGQRGGTPSQDTEGGPPASESNSQPATNTEKPPAAQAGHQNSPDSGNAGGSSPRGTVTVKNISNDGQGNFSYTTTIRDDQGQLIDIVETTCNSGNCNDVSLIRLSAEDNHYKSDANPPEDGTYPYGGDSGSGGGDTPPSDGGDTPPSGDENSGDDECQEGEECKKKDKTPAEEEKDETPPDEETPGNSTPNPNESDDRSKGLAWAMQNPDNPLAQQILKDAATAIIENSAYCQLGCSEAEAKGGLLWAMLNPDNPLAQSILADTAQAVADNSGSGQTGGVGDNPAYESNEGVSEQDLMRIELIIAGGGVVDPPESSGSGSAPDSPLTGGVGPIPSGPINSNNLEFHPLQGGARLDDGGPDDPTDPEDVQLRLNNSGRIQ